MAWLCVNKDGTETICDGCFPERNCNFWDSYISIEGENIDFQIENIDFQIELPKGSIEKLIGKILTWESEPVEI